MTLLTYEQAQARYAVGRTKLQSLVQRGVLPAYRIGKRTLMKADDLDALLLASKISPKKKIGRPRAGSRRTV